MGFVYIFPPSKLESTGSENWINYNLSILFQKYFACCNPVVDGEL